MPKRITLHVSDQHYDELRRWLDGINGTWRYPRKGDRVLFAARQAIKRSVYSTEHKERRRRALGIPKRP